MKYHKHTLKITTISPLHIGNGNSMTSIGEYNTTTNKVNMVDTEKLIALLDKENLTDAYLKEILENGKETRIWDFFSDKTIEIPYTKSITLNAPTNFNSNDNNILELAIETNGLKYIPGSTLKGSLRMLLFIYYITIENPSKLKEITALIKQVFNDLNKPNNDKTKKTFYHISQKVSNLEDTIFNKDFKYIRPEDSSLVENTNVSVEVSKRHHLYKDIDGLDNLKECIASNVEILQVLTLTPDPRTQLTTLDFIKDKNLNALFKILNHCNKKILNYEIKCLAKANDTLGKQLIETLKSYLKQIEDAKNEDAILRLGKGKTYFFQTILAFLDDDTQEKLLEIMLTKKVNAINRKIKEKNTKEGKSKALINSKDYIEKYPRTRVLTGNNEMFGWVKIESTALEEYGKMPKDFKQNKKHPNKKNTNYRKGNNKTFKKPNKQSYSVDDLKAKFNTPKNKKR